MFYFFNNIKRKDIFDLVLKAFESNDSSDIKHAVSKLLNFGVCEGITGNLWKSYLIYTLIFNDNSYTRSIELKNKEVFDFVLDDLHKYYELYTMNNSWLNEVSNFKYFNNKTNVSLAICNIISKIEDDFESFKNAILDFYSTYGVSDMAIYKAFRVSDGVLSPIYNVLDVSFDDLIGYDEQKKLLKENTEFFINGKPYNNVLLYGDSGTGKSTSIKALLNEYYLKGLRIIEVYKHQMAEISKIINALRTRPYHYIIYMDDLSFENDEVEYKYLKSIIEGGIEPKPDNVAIYATSNRRHLIKENFTDNGASNLDDLHRNETQAEKLSLAYRFGLQIYYGSLSAKEFRNMVIELAKNNNIDMDEDELIKEASRWELSYGSLSGRCATQFINYLINKA